MDGCDIALIIPDPLRPGNSFVLSARQLLEGEAPALHSEKAFWVRETNLHSSYSVNKYFFFLDSCEQVAVLMT
jgi:hypothetical protein